MTELPITRRWNVVIHISEIDGTTHARAVLTTGEAPEMVAVGEARRNPVDADVPEIGAELATARALSTLGHDLLEVAVADVQAAAKEVAASSR